MTVVLLDKAPEPTPVLYVPEHVNPHEGEPVLLGKGTRTRDGSFVSTRTWRFTNKQNGRTQLCCLMDDEMSDDAVATAKGEARENFLRDTNGLPRLVKPSAEQRRDVGAVLRDIRAAKAKRDTFTSGRIYF